jgi:hypothetical protein
MTLIQEKKMKSTQETVKIVKSEHVFFKFIRFITIVFLVLFAFVAFSTMDHNAASFIWLIVTYSLAVFLFTKMVEAPLIVRFLLVGLILFFGSMGMMLSSPLTGTSESTQELRKKRDETMKTLFSKPETESKPESEPEVSTLPVQKVTSTQLEKRFLTPVEMLANLNQRLGSMFPKNASIEVHDYFYNLKSEDAASGDRWDALCGRMEVTSFDGLPLRNSRFYHHYGPVPEVPATLQFEYEYKNSPHEFEKHWNEHCVEGIKKVLPESDEFYMGLN